MSDDLYRVLSVRRNASAKTVHAAYRRLSKSVHPDVGGSEEAFARIKLARDVLTDLERRARYDATGLYDQGMPDNERANVLGLISRVMDVVLGSVLKSGTSITQVDLAGLVRSELQKISAQIAERLREFARCEAAWREALPRCESTEGQSVMAVLIAGKLDAIEQARQRMGTEIRLVEAATRFMADQMFRYDVVQTVQSNPFMTTTFWRTA